MKMKAITIHQPWATLIALLEKGNETRSRRTHYRGPIKSTLAKYGYTADNLPTGAVLAIANLSECWAIGADYESGMPYLFNGEGGATKSVSLKEEKFGDYSFGRSALQMSDVQRLPEPIPAKGQQGLWNWEVGTHE